MFQCSSCFGYLDNILPLKLLKLFLNFTSTWKLYNMNMIIIKIFIIRALIKIFRMHICESIHVLTPLAYFILWLVFIFIKTFSGR